MLHLKNINIYNFLKYIFSILIVISIFIFINNKIKELKKEESIKIVNYANVLQLLNNEPEIPTSIHLFLLKIIEQNTTIPVILIDEKGNYIDSKNIKDKIVENPSYLKKELEDMRKQHDPIPVNLSVFGKQYIYYKNSVLLTQLEYYPFLLILLIIIFIGFLYRYFNISKKSEQNILWTGMAKETAHQIGTPLSSIIGWLEIIKFQHGNSTAIENIEKDINRLQIITDRFSKIGSIPVLKQTELISLIKGTIQYLKGRISPHVYFKYNIPHQNIIIPLNSPLFSWVIENIIKNAVDAMKGKGTIQLTIQESTKNIIIDIADTGSGILSKNIKKIFKPGFTTKKRGWGLGLSLTYRIIYEYHHGKVFVLLSQINKGTTFRIILKK